MITQALGGLSALAIGLGGGEDLLLGAIGAILCFLLLSHVLFGGWWGIFVLPGILVASFALRVIVIK